MDDRTIKLWHSDCAATEAEYPQYWRILDPIEQQQAFAIKNELRRRRYVGVHARLRMLLGNVVNTAPEHLSLGTAEHGKPYLVDYPELSFNLSHSADKMAVAIAYNCDLGIDIEQYKIRQNLAGLVDKCFAEEEKRYWQRLPEAEQMQAFYRFWTRKEAFVKATGKGIALGLQHCVINPQEQSELLRIPVGYGQVDEWLIQEIDLGEPMYGALAVRSKLSVTREGWHLTRHSLVSAKENGANPS